MTDNNMRHPDQPDNSGRAIHENPDTGSRELDQNQETIFIQNDEEDAVKQDEKDNNETNNANS